MRLLPSAGDIISSPSAKIPGLHGASSTLKLDSQRNHRDHSSRRWSKLGSTPFRASESLTIREMFSIPQLLEVVPLARGCVPRKFVGNCPGNGHRVVDVWGGRQRVTSARSVTPVSCCLASFLVLLRYRFRLRILPLG